MKFLAIMLVLVAGTLQASDADLWKQYKELKATSYNNVSQTVQKYLDTAKVAEQLKRTDIAAWNYNNAGSALIDEFKKVSKYHDFNKQISAEKDLTERKEKRNAFKQSLKDNIGLLNEAHGYLAQSAAIAEHNDVKEKIKSNLGFIQWVEKFSSEEMEYCGC